MKDHARAHPKGPLRPREVRADRIHAGRIPAVTVPAANPLSPERVEELRLLADRYGVRDIRIFGSRARGEAREGSDLDLFVRVDYGRGGSHRLVRFCLEASRALGLKVDVVTEASLDPVLHERILREARAL